jgi:ribosomal protein S18 acetylase RimI-like enzyme
MHISPEIEIRRARETDAAEIANVHLNAWREAYAGVLPQLFLDQLPLTFKRRMDAWERMLREPEKHEIWVAEAKPGIVGFCSTEAARDDRFNGFGEVAAIYLFEAYQGQGLGRELLRNSMRSLARHGYSKAYCWVLEKNSTIEFYSKSGAVFNGLQKLDEIAGEKVTELAYEWSDISAF